MSQYLSCQLTIVSVMFLFKYFLKQTEVTMETADWWNGAELVHHYP